MRRLLALLVIVATASTAEARPPDPLDQAVAWLAHADRGVRERAFDVLVLRADLARLADARLGLPNEAPATPEVREAFHGARYFMQLADRLKASAAGSVARYLLLEEALGSAWAGHVDALLERAGLTPADACKLLAERAAARVAYETYFDAAFASVNDPKAAMVAVAKVGPALVPQLLKPLAIVPWLAAQGWPAGEPIVIRQRISCWGLKALKAVEAVPYLLVHVDAPSGTLQWDVLDTLVSLTGDAAWKVDVSDMERLGALRPTWWKEHGKPHAAAARAYALDALREATSFLVSLRADPTHWRNGTIDGAPDALRSLFERLGEFGLATAKDLPAPAKALEALDAPAWLARIGSAVAALEEAP